MNDKNKWLLVLGVRDGYDLPPIAKKFLKTADGVIGSRRNLALVTPSLPATTMQQELTRPFANNIDWLKKMKIQHKKIAFVATGDPSFFGAAKILRDSFDHKGMLVVPAVSIVSMVAATIGWAIEDSITLSTHGSDVLRPIAQLVRHLHHGAKIIVIARDGAQLAAIASLLKEKKFGDSRLTIFANLGEDNEKITQLPASAVTASQQFEMDFYTIAIDAIADNNAARGQLITTAGHPVDFFNHDGQITKPETRAIILSKLQPAPKKILWDIGAGAGSVTIEWALCGGQAVAVEEKKNRYDNIITNIAQFGLQNHVIAINESAEKFLANKKNQQPDVVFVGGGVSNKKLMTMAWRSLPSHGRLVSASHSVEGQMAQHEHQQQWGGDIMTISIAEKKAMTNSKKFHAMTTQQQTTLHIVDKK